MNPMLLLAASLSVVSLTQTQAIGSDLIFNVDINTSVLGSAPDGPFYLDFSLIPNGGTSSNTATISRIQLTGGAGVGSPASGYHTMPATASGSLSTGFNLSTNGAFAPGQDDAVGIANSDANGTADIFQQFDSSVTDIKFTVDLSQASTSGLNNFTIAILHGDTPADAVAIYTAAPDTESLVQVDVGNSGDPHDLPTAIHAYASNGNSADTDFDGGVLATVTAAPEPSTWAMMAIAGIAFLVIRRRQTNS